jgi:hypothetical protein
MTTANFENWAGRIADIGPIYPFVGSEFLLFIVGLIFYIGWQVMQLRIESNEYKDDMRRLGGKDGLSKALDRDNR